MEQNSKWVLCPACNNKTRLQIRQNTKVENLPLYCPKCKIESIINIHDLEISVVESTEALERKLSEESAD